MCCPSLYVWIRVVEAHFPPALLSFLCVCARARRLPPLVCRWSLGLAFRPHEWLYGGCYPWFLTGHAVGDLLVLPRIPSRSLDEQHLGAGEHALLTRPWPQHFISDPVLRRRVMFGWRFRAVLCCICPGFEARNAPLLCGSRACENMGHRLSLSSYPRACASVRLLMRVG